jgi:hypothetical protein
VFTGSSEGELKAWSIDREAIAEGIKETNSGQVFGPFFVLKTCKLTN